MLNFMRYANLKKLHKEWENQWSTFYYYVNKNSLPFRKEWLLKLFIFSATNKFSVGINTNIRFTCS